MTPPTSSVLDRIKALWLRFWRLVTALIRKVKWKLVWMLGQERNESHREAKTDPAPEIEQQAAGKDPEKVEDGEVYRYKPLDRERREIRLVRVRDFNLATVGAWDPLAATIAAEDPSFATMIEEAFGVEISIEHVSLDDNPNYVALSYTWGSESKPKVVQLFEDIDGEEEPRKYKFPVTENLYTAFRHIRPDYLPNAGETGLLWVDAICINQEDEEERSWQVQEMQKIFAQASNVMIFLGPQIQGSSAFMDEVKDSFDKCRKWFLANKTEDNHPNWSKNFHLPGDFNHFDALTAFTEHPYWRRVWVQQEMNAKPHLHTWIQWGPKIVNMTNFYIFTDGLKNLYRKLQAKQLAVEENWVTAEQLGSVLETEAYEMMIQGVNRSYPNDETRNLATLARILAIIYVDGFGLYSHDARDLLYACFGMAVDIEKLGVVPDYRKTVEEVYLEVAKALIDAHEIEVIRWANHYAADTGEEVAWGLPSWVPDWRLPIPKPFSVFTKFFSPDDVAYSACRNLGKDFSTFHFKDPKRHPAYKGKLQLSCYGVFVDKITVISDLMQHEDKPGDGRARGPSEGPTEQSEDDAHTVMAYTPIFNAVPRLDWLDELEKLMVRWREAQPADSAVSLKGEPWQVPIADVELMTGGDDGWKYARATPGFAPGYQLLRDGCLQPDQQQPFSTEDTVLAQSYWLVMENQCNRRRYMAGEGGMLGLGPGAARPGDWVVVLVPISIPLVVRPLENGHFHLVGEAYVNGGTMDGTAIQGKYDLREFLLD